MSGLKKFNFIFLLFLSLFTYAQRDAIHWSNDGLFFYSLEDGNIVKNDPRKNSSVILVKKELLTPKGETASLEPDNYFFSNDNSKLLLFANTEKVWRYRTRGDYWVADLQSGKLTKLGNGLPSQSLMFAKFSPDSKNVAYVSEHNIYVESIE